MLKTRWSRPACRNALVPSRHHSPVATSGPKSAPFSYSVPPMLWIPLPDATSPRNTATLSVIRAIVTAPRGAGCWRRSASAGLCVSARSAHRRIPGSGSRRDRRPCSRCRSAGRSSSSSRRSRHAGAGSTPSPWSFQAGPCGHRSGEGGVRASTTIGPVRVHVAFTPAETVPAPTGIVIDVLRATSTIVQALASGYRRALCCGEIEEAKAVREAEGEGLLAGERQCVRIPGFDLGNSPKEFLEPLGETVILTTTNGTRALVAAAAELQACLCGKPAQPGSGRRIGPDRRRRCCHRLCGSEGGVRDGRRILCGTNRRAPPR